MHSGSRDGVPMGPIGSWDSVVPVHRYRRIVRPKRELCRRIRQSGLLYIFLTSDDKRHSHTHSLRPGTGSQIDFFIALCFVLLVVVVVVVVVVIVVPSSDSSCSWSCTGSIIVVDRGSSKIQLIHFSHSILSPSFLHSSLLLCALALSPTPSAPLSSLLLSPSSFLTATSGGELQPSQLEAPFPLYLPAAHLMQSDNPAVEYCPAGQSSHE